ncbi:hypothetical protein ABPG75_009100 [Micractinium tetrahymenae]
MLLVLLAALRPYPLGPPRPAPDAPALPPVLPAEVPPNCLHLHRVCVDQQQIVMMDPAYLPQNEERPLPQTKPEPWKLFFNLPVTADTNPDVWVSTPRLLHLLVFRRPTVAEPSPDLRHPRFHQRTLPLLFVPDWPENFGHTLGNSATYLHAHLRARNVSWADGVQLVVHTPFGLALPRHWQSLVGPLFQNRPIQTFADFSNRPEPRPLGWGAGILGRRAAFGGPPPSRSRCFAQMLVCPGLKENQAINISQASATASFITRSYSKGLPSPSSVTYTSSSPECSGAASSAAALGRGRACLRVLFKARQARPAVRQILNMPELLEQCRRWRFTDPKTGTTFVAACASWQPGSDLAANIAAVQNADILVGKHGAGMANSFFMRPGGAMMEIFSTGWTWQVHREWLDQEERPRLQWWGLTVQDPALLEPGELEARLMPHPRLYNVSREGTGKRLRDRNLRVPWAGLDHLLREHARVQAAGGMAAYWDRRLTNPQPVHYCWVPAGRLQPCGTGLQGGPFRPGRDNRQLLNRTRIIE